METKVIGSALITLSCAGFGFTMAAKYRNDIQFLQAVINMISQMQCELNYRLTPLPQLCRRTNPGSSKILGKIMEEYAKALDSQISPNAENCMQIVVGSDPSLSEIMSEILLELGQALGKFDLHGQQQSLDVVYQSCNRKLEELVINKEARIRGYKTLGLCAGAALALLLF